MFTSWRREEPPYATLALSALIVGLDTALVGRPEASRQNRATSLGPKFLNQGDQGGLIDEPRRVLRAEPAQKA